jgi:hypothetical protein
MQLDTTDGESIAIVYWVGGASLLAIVVFGLAVGFLLGWWWRGRRARGPET